MIKKILCSIFVGVFIFLPFAKTNAQEFTSDLQPQVYVKNLNITNNKVAPGEGIKGFFVIYSIDNRAAVNYSYVISLLKDTSNGEVEIGSSPHKTFDMGPKGSKNIDFSYVAPNVSGKVTFKVTTYGPTGFEINYVKKLIDISGNGKILDIPSALLVVGGEKFSLQNGPTINGTTSAYVLVSLKNTTGESLNFIPKVSLYVKSVDVGEKITDYSLSKITLANGEEKSIKVDIQVPSKPEVYEGVINFDGGQDILAPKIPFRFIRGGKIATIQSVTSDQVKIEKGISLPVTVTYTGIPFDISSSKSESDIPVVFNVDLVGDDGSVLGKASLSTSLAPFGSEKIDVPVENKYKGAVSAKVSIASNDGTVLATGTYLLVSPEFAATSSTASSSALVNFIKDNWKFGFATILVILVSGILVMIFVKTRNVSTLTILAFVISGSLLCGSYYITHIVKAATTLSGEQSYISSGIGCSYKDLVVTNKDYSYSLDVVDNAKSAAVIVKNKTCQYVTESTSGVFTVRSLSSCVDISHDETTNTCKTISGAKSVIAIVPNCVAVNKQFDTVNGSTYKNFKAVSEKTYSSSLVDKYIASCSAASAYSFDVCQYVVSNTVKNTMTLGTVNACKSISLDENAGTCTYTLNTGASKTVSNCTAVNKKSDSLSFDISMGCKIDYNVTTTVRGQPVVTPKVLNVQSCRTLGNSDGVCTYFYKGAVRVQKDCTGMTDYSKDYDITGVPSADAQRVSLVNFTAPSGPDADGKIVLNAGDTQDVSGNVYFAACKNSPTGASVYLTLIDPDGHATGYRYKKGYSVSKVGGEGWSIGLNNGFKDSFVVSSKPGKYSILYVVSVVAGKDGDRSSSHQGHLDFWVKDNSSPCDVGGACRSEENNCGNTNSGTITSCDEDGTPVCSADAPEDVSEDECTPPPVSCIPDEDCTSVANNCGHTETGLSKCDNNNVWSCSASKPADESPCSTVLCSDGTEVATLAECPGHGGVNTGGVVVTPTLDLFVCKETTSDSNCNSNAVQIPEGGNVKLKYDIQGYGDCSSSAVLSSGPLNGVVQSGTAVGTKTDEGVATTKSYTVTCGGVSKTVRAVVVSTKEF